MTQYSYPSGENVWVPRYDVEGGLLTGFSRNVNSYPLNRYSQLVPVAKPTGYYGVWNSRQFLRVRESNISDFIWAPGQPRPNGSWNTEAFSFVYYEAERYDFPVILDQQAVNLADFAILSAHTEMLGDQCMLARTINAATTLSNVSWGTHTATATTASAAAPSGGGYFNVGTDSNPVILAAFQYGWTQINQDTGGSVNPDQTVFVVSVPGAAKMASSGEVHAYVKSSPFAQAALRGDSASLNAGWGLPDMLYGARIVVENTVQDTSQKSATFGSDTLAYVYPDTTTYLLSRPGALVGVEGTPSWSTLIGLFYQEMQTETFSDPKDRLTEVHVSDYYVYIVSPVGQYSGFQFTASFAA